MLEKKRGTMIIGQVGQAHRPAMRPGQTRGKSGKKSKQDFGLAHLGQTIGLKQGQNTEDKGRVLPGFQERREGDLPPNNPWLKAIGEPKGEKQEREVGDERRLSPSDPNNGPSAVHRRYWPEATQRLLPVRNRKPGRRWQRPAPCCPRRAAMLPPTALAKLSTRTY